MSTTSPSRRKTPWLLQVPQVRDFAAPEWFERLPAWLTTGGVLLFLLTASAVVRTRYFGGQFWSDEATAVGVASHSLTAIPGLLRQTGASPLYYVVLHFWIDAFGSGERATHVLSLLFGLSTIPIGMWAGWSLFGRRAGMYAAILFAFNAFLTRYAQETQAWELLSLIALVATASFLHAFVFGRRRYLYVLGVSLALMIYTSFVAVLFWIGLAVALVVVRRTADDRRALARDAGLTFAGAVVLYAPWLGNLIFQIGHTTSPWHFVDFVGATFPGNMLGGDRVAVTLGIAAIIAILPLLTPDRRGTPVATAIWALIAVPVTTVVLARIIAFGTPTWVTRYFAPLIAPMLLLGALCAARAGVMGLITIVLSIAFIVNVASYTPKYKSDMRDVAGELAPYLHPNDLVLVGEPEQAPLAWYYLPSKLRYATTTGAVRDPSYMNWVGAYGKLADSNPRAMLNALVASLQPGQRLMYVRPLTEGVKQWKQKWAELVRRRAAQWSALIAADRELVPIAGAVAPRNYLGSCCTADSAVVYTKVG